MNLLLIYLVIIIFNIKLKKIRADIGGKISLERFKLFNKIYFHTREQLFKIDETSTFVLWSILIIRYILPIIILLYSVLNGFRDFVVYVGLIVIIESLLVYYFYSNRKTHIRIFESNIYQIYKYINNMKSAGVTTQKLILKLPTIVEDERLKKNLINFAAHYYAKNDYNAAFNEHITRYYGSEDADILDSTLRQGLEVGDVHTNSEEAEALMLDKAMALRDYETELIRKYYIGIGLLYTAIIVIFSGYPVIIQTIEGLKNIFSN